MLAWYGHSGWLTGTLMTRAFAALTVSPGAAGCCHDVRARGIEHDDGLRRLAGILRACLKTRTLYREATAWSHCLEKLAA